MCSPSSSSENIISTVLDPVYQRFHEVTRRRVLYLVQVRINVYIRITPHINR